MKCEIQCLLNNIKLACGDVTFIRCYNLREVTGRCVTWKNIQTKRHDFKNIIQLFIYISCVYTKLLVENSYDNYTQFIIPMDIIINVL